MEGANRRILAIASGTSNVRGTGPRHMAAEERRRSEMYRPTSVLTESRTSLAPDPNMGRAGLGVGDQLRVPEEFCNQTVERLGSLEVDRVA